jgi:hypothetical protein
VWTYIVRRLLLMFPMLFGISVVNFGILNLAPAPRSSNVKQGGDLDLSSSMEANEGQYIFRRTFNLDKPAFLNWRYGLTDEEVFWKLASTQRPWETPKDRKEASMPRDYGRTIAPPPADRRAAHSEREALRAEPRADYEQRRRRSDGRSTRQASRRPRVAPRRAAVRRLLRPPGHAALARPETHRGGPSSSTVRRRSRSCSPSTGGVEEQIRCGGLPGRTEDMLALGNGTTSAWRSDHTPG